MLKISIVYVSLDDLKSAPRNARRHSVKQLRKLTTNIQTNGSLVPILIDRSGRIIAGHGRVEAARRAGLTEVPAIYVEHLSPAQIEALALAENRISDDAGYSAETLSQILRDLAVDVDFDLSTTGYDVGEIDFMLVEQDDGDDGEPVEANRSTGSISRVGDTYVIGSHRIACGDARDAAVYTRLFGSDRAQASISDFPYDLPINGHVSGAGRHSEFPMASGEMSRTQFTQFIRTTAARIVECSADGSLHYIFMDHRHIRELLDGCQDAFSEQLNLCVWKKNNGGLGSLYRSQHELVFVFKNGNAAHINNVMLGKYGRNRTNIWEYPGANSFGKGRRGMLDRHATSKPIALIADAIMDCSHHGGVILDAFLGSGTTVLAAQRTGRRCFGIELDPHFVDMSVQRAAAAVGEAAIHLESGLTFDALAALRSADNAGAVL